MATIFHQVVINADCPRIYDAVTTQEGLSKWWITDCTVKPEVGFMNEFRVPGHGIIKMRVVDLQHGQRVEWECCNDDDEWTGTRIVFEIHDKENGSVLNFKQLNWKSESEFYATCNYHWARHLGMLVRLCETGVSELDDQIEREEVRKVMSN